MRFVKQSEMYDSSYSYQFHPNEVSQEFHYYPFAVKLDRCLGSCNTLNNLSNKVCIPNKTEDLNLSMLNQHVYRNKSIENINKVYIIRM